jgi:hypothetical protein
MKFGAAADPLAAISAAKPPPDPPAEKPAEKVADDKSAPK